MIEDEPTAPVPQFGRRHYVKLGEELGHNAAEGDHAADERTTSHAKLDFVACSQSYARNRTRTFFPDEVFGFLGKIAYGRVAIVTPRPRDVKGRGWSRARDRIAIGRAARVACRSAVMMCERDAAALRLVCVRLWTAYRAFIAAVYYQHNRGRRSIGFAFLASMPLRSFTNAVGEGVQTPASPDDAGNAG